MTTVSDARGNAKRHYWVREDFDHLMGLLPGGDHEFPGERKSSTSLFYPKNTEGAFRELRLRGLYVDGIYLWQLAEKGHVQPKGARPNMVWTGEDYLEWSKEDIDGAAEWIYDVTIARKVAKIIDVEGATLLSWYFPRFPSTSAVFFRFYLANKKHLLGVSSLFSSTTFEVGRSGSRVWSKVPGELLEQLPRLPAGRNQLPSRTDHRSCIPR